jgi:hypothetical protein
MGRTRVVVSSPKPNTIITQSPGRTDIVTEGRVGPRGPAGESAYQTWLDQGNIGSEADFLASLIGGNYTYIQMNPESVWTINHNLDFFPNVTAFDSAGTEIVGSIEHQSAKVLTITFTSATGGTAYLS